MIVLVALLPTGLVSYLLLDKVVEQSREQVLSSLTHRGVLQSELLERELSIQLNTFEQLAQLPDIKLTPSSAIFGYQAREQLKKFTVQSPLSSASYILDSDNLPVETYPIGAMQLQLKSVISRIQPFLQQVEHDQIFKPLIFNINDPEIVATLSTNNLSAPINNSWVMVMVLPLVQKTQHGNTNFKVVGSIITLEPYQFFNTLLEKWRSKSGGLVLLDQNVELYSSGLIKEDEDDINILTWDTQIKLADKTFILRISEPSEGIKAIVFEDLWRLSLVVGAILLLVSFISLLVARLVGEQIDKLISQVKAFSQGEYQYRVSGLRFAEFLQVSAVLEQLSQKVITDQTQLESKVKERTTALSQANADLNATLAALTETQNRLIQSEKMASLGGLVAGVAHELNTPLGICISAIALIEEVDKNLHEMVTGGSLKKSALIHQLQILSDSTLLIGKNINRAGDLITVFKELSISHENENEEVAEFELRSFLQQQVNDWQDSHKNTGLNILVSGDNVFVRTYKQSLRKVLSLLFKNAVDHAFKKQMISAAELELSCRQSNGSVELFFMDNGSGVNIEPIAQIFEPFYTSNRYQGSVGLGLHIAYNLVSQRLQGEIEAQNREQGGLKLSIHFPCTLNC